MNYSVVYSNGIDAKEEKFLVFDKAWEFYAKAVGDGNNTWVKLTQKHDDDSWEILEEYSDEFSTNLEAVEN